MNTQNDFDPGPVSEVAYETHGKQWTLVFTRDLRHPPEKVWATLTDPAHLAKWAPYTADRNLGMSGTAILELNEGKNPKAYVSEVHAEPPHVLEHTWGTDKLRWELTATRTGTRLTLHQTVKELEWLPKMAAGWQICLSVAEYLLDGKSIGPILGKESRDYGWERLNDTYSQKLGIPNTGWPLDQ